MMKARVTPCARPSSSSARPSAGRSCRASASVCPISRSVAISRASDWPCLRSCGMFWGRLMTLSMKDPVRFEPPATPFTPRLAEFTRDNYVLPSCGRDIIVTPLNRLRPPRSGLRYVKESFETHKFVGNRRGDDKIAFKLASRIKRDNFVRHFSLRDIVVFDREERKELRPSTLHAKTSRKAWHVSLQVAHADVHSDGRAA